MCLPSSRSFSARPPGSSRESVSPCSSRSTIIWWSIRRRRSALSSPVDAPFASSRNRCSTASETASGVVWRATAMALIGLPSAMKVSSSWSASLRSSPACTGRTSASTITGSSRVPPVATARMASMSWSPSASRSFSRYEYPAAPSASSETAYSGSSYWDRITIPVPGFRCRISLAASMPSRWNVGGMRMSLTTTCGWCSAAAARSSGWSEASPTTSTSGSRASRARTPARTMRLSSASTTVITPSGMVTIEPDPAEDGEGAAMRPGGGASPTI